MVKKKTIKVRCYSDMADELKIRFPGVNMADLLKTAYHTSPLKVESGLRKMKKTPLFKNVTKKKK